MELFGVVFSWLGSGYNGRCTKEKIDASVIESALSTLQMVIVRPATLFDPYAAIAALGEVVNVTKEKKNERASRY